jgi:hypothetical protein
MPKTSNRTEYQGHDDARNWWASDKGSFHWSDQLGLPFTEVPHLVLEDWLMNLALVEIRIVGVVLRLTVGWHRERTKPLPLSFLCCITKHSKPIVLEALSRLAEYGVLNRSRLSRRQPFCYSLIFNRHFNELQEAPAAAKQQALPLNVQPLRGKENFTTQLPREVKKTLPLRGKENLTTQPAVLSSLKKKDLNKHTHSVAPVENVAVENSEAAAPRVCVNQIDRKRYKAYARAQLGIVDPVGWTTKAEQTRQWDEEVLEWEEAQRKLEAQRAAEAERQRLEVEAWQEQRQNQKPVVVEPVALPLTFETPEERQAREQREGQDREATERGQQMLAEIRGRVERRKLGSG